MFKTKEIKINNQIITAEKREEVTQMIINILSESEKESKSTFIERK